MSVKPLSLFVAAALLSAYARAADETPAANPQPSAETVDARDSVSAVVVRANRNTPRQSSDNYTVKGSTSASKLDLKLKETPQSITVLTQQQMQDQNLRNLNDILEETPGITVLHDSVPGVSDSEYYSRGFPVNNYQLDGVMVNRDMLGNRTMQDSFLYDRIEVVRGSTGLTTGAGDPAASINFVRKRPSAEKAGALNLKYGSWGDKRIEFDYGGALNQSKTLKGRFVATMGHGGSFLDRVKQRSHAVYGVLEWSLDDKNFLTFGHRHQYQIVRGAPRKGVSRYSRVMLGRDPNTLEEIQKWIDERDTPPSFNNGANWAFDKQQTENSFIEYKHFFTPNFSLQAAYNRTRYQTKFLYGDIGTLGYAPAYNAATYEWGRGNHRFDGEALDIFADGKFKLFDQEQQVIVGISGERVTARGGYYPSEATEDLDIRNIKPDGIAMNGNYYTNNRYLVRAMPLDYWNNGDFPMMAWSPLSYFAPVGPEETQSGGLKSKVRQFGPYFALKLKPHKKITAVLGGRWLNWKRQGGSEWTDLNKLITHKMKDLNTKPADEIYEYPISSASFRKFVPYGGLIVDITPSFTAYASYTGIAKRNDALKESYFKRQPKGGGDFPPITGNSKEFGIKGGLFDDRLNFSLAYFTMTQNGYPTFEALGWGPCERDPATGECINRPLEYGITKGYKSSGFDINIAGKITPKWLMQAGFVKLKMRNPFDDQPSFNDTGDDLNLDYGESYSAPDKTFKFFTRYDFTPKFSAGIGMRWNSGVKPRPWAHTAWKIGVVDKPREMWQPSYSVWNAMASYKINKNAAVAVNIGNLFNKRYYTNARSNFYGKPRNIAVALKMKW